MRRRTSAPAAAGAPDRHEPAAAGSPPPAQRRRAEATPAQRAIALLARREHSGRELVRKLTARGIESAEAEATVGRLAEAGWQDDARFAELLVRSRAGAGQGPVRIRAELATHGLEPGIVAAALAAFDGQWDEQARDLARRRYGAALHEDRQVQRKAFDFLIRRGFTAEQVRAATRLDPDDPWG